MFNSSYFALDEVDGVITFTDLRADVFLPANRRKFYRYDGSLTTPNCDEDVVWTIMQDAVNVSKEQVIQADGKPLLVTSFSA